MPQNITKLWSRWSQRKNSFSILNISINYFWRIGHTSIYLTWKSGCLRSNCDFLCTLSISSMKYKILVLSRESRWCFWHSTWVRRTSAWHSWSWKEEEMGTANQTKAEGWALWFTSLSFLALEVFPMAVIKLNQKDSQTWGFGSKSLLCITSILCIFFATLRIMALLYRYLQCRAASYREYLIRVKGSKFMVVVPYSLTHILAHSSKTAGVSHCLALYLISLQEVSESLGGGKDSRTSEDEHIMPSPCTCFKYVPAACGSLPLMGTQCFSELR